MSFEIGVWDADEPPGVTEAARRFAQLRGGEAAAAPSPRVTAFVEECGRRWPDGSDGDPSPITGERTPTGFVASIRPEDATDLYGELSEMSERHGLVLFDPQSGMVRIPSRLSYDAQPPTLVAPRFALRLPWRRSGRRS